MSSPKPLRVVDATGSPGALPRRRPPVSPTAQWCVPCLLSFWLERGSLISITTSRRTSGQELALGSLCSPFACRDGERQTGKEIALKHRHTRKHGRLVRDAMLTGAFACVLAVGQDIRPSSAHAPPAHAHSAHASPAHARWAHALSEHTHSAHAKNGLDHSSHDEPAADAGATHAGGSYSGAGLASVYSGGQTASGEHMTAGGMTAAHRTLPFGTSVTVLNSRNGRAVVVTINDRGPFVRGRVIDLSPAAARAIGISGLAPVSLTAGHGG